MLPLLTDSLRGLLATMKPCHSQVRLKPPSSLTSALGLIAAVGLSYLGSATSIWLMVSRSTRSSCICLTASSNFFWSDGLVTPI